MRGAVKRVALEALGWLLVVVGIAAIPLPGPGFLILAGGLILLSQQYEWAERRVEPIKREALKGAANSVETWPRIVASSIFIGLIAGAGVLWFVSPPAPGWWPVAERWWLYGGKATSISQFVSAALAAGLLVWSYRKFHGNPEAIAAVETSAAEDDDRKGFFGD
jgi:putative transmembrane protein PGPGW